jgi:uncharacterized protein (UPF0332 family)
MLKDKATSALAAADLLFERGFTNDAASRYYYAMHLAAVTRLADRGVAPGAFQSGAKRWEHATIANNTMRLRGRREDRALYNAAMRLRTQADYLETEVRADQISSLRASIRGFVLELTA